MKENPHDERRKSSLCRLSRLDVEKWNPGQFRLAVRTFTTANPQLSWRTYVGGEALPPLLPDAVYTYPEQYDSAGESTDNWFCSTCQDQGQTVGFAIAQRAEGQWRIGFLDVAEEYRRRAETLPSVQVTCGEEVFFVGIGHCVASTLIEYLRALSRTLLVTVDASYAESRYIFLSLGFRFEPELEIGDDPIDRIGEMVLQLDNDT